VASYVGCIAGAVPIARFERLLVEAGFSGVQVVDSGSDLNAYAKVENQAGCCSPAMESGSGLPVAGGCCSPAETSEDGIHDGLADLLKRYDVNDYAASVKVFAVRAR
jgi:hypothetical protein